MTFKNKPDVLMQRYGDLYKYVSIFVEHLAIAMVDSEAFFQTLCKKYYLKLEGIGPLFFHLRCNIYRDDNETSRLASKKYIERMVDNYESIFD